MGDELFVLVSKVDGVPVQKLFASKAAVEQHLRALGAPGPDNEHIRSGLELRRYVIADLEAA